MNTPCFPDGSVGKAFFVGPSFPNKAFVVYSPEKDFKGNNVLHFYNTKEEAIEHKKAIDEWKGKESAIILEVKSKECYIDQ